MLSSDSQFAIAHWEDWLLKAQMFSSITPQLQESDTEP